jgi:FixJ family two-component response regulator
MDKLTGTVFLVDDDPRVLKAMARLLGSDGWCTRTYRSAREFLADHDCGVPGCLVLDLLMPDMTGLDLQRELARRGDRRPIVFLSGRGDVPSSVSAMKSGAVDFLTKPVDSEILLSAVTNAMEDDARQRAAANRTCGVRTRLSSLTARERQVLDGVVAGLLNKQIAGRLGIVEKTVKVHRARAVAKLGVRSTAELVRMVQIAAGDQIYGTAQAPSVEQGLHS